MKHEKKKSAKKRNKTKKQKTKKTQSLAGNHNSARPSSIVKLLGILRKQGTERQRDSDGKRGQRRGERQRMLRALMSAQERKVSTSQEFVSEFMSS